MIHNSDQPIIIQSDGLIDSSNPIAHQLDSELWIIIR